MSRLSGTDAIGCLLAAIIAVMPGATHADTITYFGGGSYFDGQTLSNLGYNASDSSIESSSETYAVPGLTGTTTRLDFTFIQDLGGYKFSFGFFDRSAATANPVADRQTWALQALSAATVVFDNRDISAGETASFTVAAGAELGLFLIPNDTLQAVLEDPGTFYGGSRPDPLFSVSDANPGSFDQLLSFEVGGLYTFAFEDLSRAGTSDHDFNDLVVTMTATPEEGQLTSLAEVVSEPSGLALAFLTGLAIFWTRTRRRA